MSYIRRAVRPPAGLNPFMYVEFSTAVLKVMVPKLLRSRRRPEYVGRSTIASPVSALDQLPACDQFLYVRVVMSPTVPPYEPPFQDVFAYISLPAAPMTGNGAGGGRVGQAGR